MNKFQVFCDDCLNDYRFVDDCPACAGLLAYRAAHRGLLRAKRYVKPAKRWSWRKGEQREAF